MPVNTAENFERFRSLVLSDITMQAQLRDIADKKEFIEAVIDLGAKSGFVFTREDVKQAMQENISAWIMRWI
jgi:hypothetical protein